MQNVFLTIFPVIVHFQHLRSDSRGFQKFCNSKEV